MQERTAGGPIHLLVFPLIVFASVFSWHCVGWQHSSCRNNNTQWLETLFHEVVSGHCWHFHGWLCFQQQIVFCVEFQWMMPCLNSLASCVFLVTIWHFNSSETTVCVNKKTVLVFGMTMTQPITKDSWCLKKKKKRILWIRRHERKLSVHQISESKLLSCGCANQKWSACVADDSRAHEDIWWIGPFAFESVSKLACECSFFDKIRWLSCLASSGNKLKWNGMEGARNSFVDPNESIGQVWSFCMADVDRG